MKGLPQFTFLQTQTQNWVRNFFLGLASPCSFQIPFDVDDMYILASVKCRVLDFKLDVC